MNKPKYIAWMGGGVRGCAHPGVLYALNQHGLDTEIEGSYGTSVGAIMAMCHSMEMPAMKIKKLLDDLDFSSLKDRGIVSDIWGLDYFGLYPGKVLLDWIREQIKSVTGNPDSTFEDFAKAGFLDLNVFACEMNTCSLKQFNAALTPKDKVSDGVISSASIPWFYEAHLVNGKFYRDGGMIKNYPVDAMDLDPEHPCMDMIGACFGLDTSMPDNGIKPGEYKKAIQSDFDLVLAAQYVAQMKYEAKLKRSIIIDTHGISATNFDITYQEKQLLFQSGRLGTEKKIAAT